MSQVINWYGLPAVIIKEKNKLVVFTNVERKLSSFTIPYDERDDKKYYNLAIKKGVFKCLYHKNDVRDEFTVVLSLTEKCNCRCRYCFLDAEAEGKVMSKDLIKVTVDYAFDNSDGRSINFAAFGGEPSTQPELLEYLVQYVSEKKELSKYRTKNVRFSITTNGVLSERMLELLITNKFIVSLSMDGIKEVQNYHRPLANGNETYDIVCKTIERLVEAGLSVKIRATVTQFSVDKMAETVEVLGKMGIKKIHFGAVTPGGRGCTENKLLQPPTAECFTENLIKAIKQGKESGVDVLCFPYLNLDETPKTFCDGTVKNRIVVTPQGIVSSCVEVQSVDHPLYDALSLGYYDENNKKLVITADGRRVKCGGCEHFSKAIDKSKCNKCPFLFFCGSGCATRNYRGSGDTSSVDEYRCEIIKGVMPYILENLVYSTYNFEGR